LAPDPLSGSHTVKHMVDRCMETLAEIRVAGKDFDE
jgi:hypothetical protein